MFKLHEKMKYVNGGKQARLSGLHLRGTLIRFATYPKDLSVYTRRMPCFHSISFQIKEHFISLTKLLSCTACEGLFPQEEFSKTQLKRREQRCRVCKEIKHKEDVQINRESQWKGRRLEREQTDYFDSDDEVCW